MLMKNRSWIVLAAAVSVSGAISPVLAQGAGSLAPAFAAQKQAILDQQKADADKAAASSPPASSGATTSGSASGSASAATTASPAGATPAAAGTAASGTAAGTDKSGASSDSKKDDTAAGGDKKEETEEEKKAKADEEAERSKLTKNAEKEAYTPVKEALFDVQSGNPQAAIGKLKPALAKNAKDVQAHYVLAISYVMTRQYKEAAAQYNEVLKLVPATSKLGQLASDGLRKIQH